MSEIKITKPSKGELDSKGVLSWPIWEKEASRFPWHYNEPEVCYLLEGQVQVTPESGETVEFGAGDLVSFPAGMSCTWDIKKAVRKHYKLG